MILEGLVTTRGADGRPHLAPMGPRVAPDAAGYFDRFTLRPFATSTTYRNLRRHPEGVLHVTDDVELLARAAVGRVAPFPDCVAAEAVAGVVLTGACRYFEFRIQEFDESAERVTLEAQIVARGVLRAFFGLNRAKHAVVEAAILATRLHLLPRGEVEAEFARLAVLVAKTGGAAEVRAFAFLTDYLNQWTPGAAP